MKPNRVLPALLTFLVLVAGSSLLLEAQLRFISAHPPRGATGKDKRCDLLHSHRLHRLQ